MELSFQRNILGAEGDWVACGCKRGERPTAEADGIDVDDAVTKLHLKLLSKVA